MLVLILIYLAVRLDVTNAQVLIQVVNTKNPPLRLVPGHYAYSKFRQKLESLTQELNDWEAIAANTGVCGYSHVAAGTRGTRANV